MAKKQTKTLSTSMSKEGAAYKKLLTKSQTIIKRRIAKVRKIDKKQSGVTVTGCTLLVGACALIYIYIAHIDISHL